MLYPVLHMTRVMYTTGDKPFELVDIYYRADKYHYSVNMTRVKRQGRWTWATEVETSGVDRLTCLNNKTCYCLSLFALIGAVHGSVANQHRRLARRAHQNSRL